MRRIYGLLIWTLLVHSTCYGDVLLDIMNSYQEIEKASTSWEEIDEISIIDSTSNDVIEIKYLNKWEGVEVITDPYGEYYEKEEAF